MNEEADEGAVARVITGSIAGTRWRDLTPIDVARVILSSEWLAAHDERVRAEAWAEGHNAGMDDVWKIEREGQSGYTANPYLAAPTSEPTP